MWKIKLKVQKKSQRPHTIKKKNNKKQKQNRIFIPDYRGIPEIP